MLFSETLASMQPRDGGWQAVIGADWSQGRATFGGMVAALGNEAMRRLVPEDRELRGLETTFVGPALAGEVSLDAEILRVGKAVTIARSRLWSDGKIAATLTGIYGAARATALSITPAVAAGVHPVAGLAGPPGRGHGRRHPLCGISLTVGRKARDLSPARVCAPRRPTFVIKIPRLSPNPMWWR